MAQAAEEAEKYEGVRRLAEVRGARVGKGQERGGSACKRKLEKMVGSA